MPKPTCLMPPYDPLREWRYRCGNAVATGPNDQPRFGVGAIILVLLAFVAVLVEACYQQNNRSIYQVHVTVVDSQGILVEDIKPRASRRTEPKKVAGGWQFDFPDSNLAQGDKLSFFAAKEAASLAGKAELVLGADYYPTVVINLHHEQSVIARGKVVDNDQQAISGARVFVPGGKNEMVVTTIEGNFELPVHIAVGQPVYLQVEKDGEQTVKRLHLVNNASVLLTLYTMKERAKMDKNQYCDEMETKLESLAASLERLVFPPPSTFETSQQQARTEELVTDLKTRVAEALAQVKMLRASTSPNWETARLELERRWREVSELREQIK